MTESPHKKIDYWAERLLGAYKTDYFGFYSHLAAERKNSEYLISNTPSEWLRHYFESRYIDYDPRVIQAKNSFLPFVWNTTQTKGLKKNQKPIYEAARDYGIFTGITVPVHMDKKAFGLIGFAFKQTKIDPYAQHLPIYNKAPLVALYLISLHQALSKGHEEAVETIEKSLRDWVETTQKYEDDLKKKDLTALADSLFNFSQWLSYQEPDHLDSEHTFSQFALQQKFLLKSFQDHRHPIRIFYKS